MAEWYRGIWVIAYRDLLRFVQERPRIVAMFAFPLAFLAVLAGGLNRTIGPLAPGVDFIAFVFPGIIAMNALQLSLAAGTSIVWERQLRLLRELLVSPLSRGGIVLGKAASGAVLGVAQALVLLALAPVVGLSLDPVRVLKLIALVVLIAWSLAGLGILVAARMRSIQAYQAFMQFVTFPLTFTTGVFFPVRDAPAWLQVVAKLNPATYGVDAVRRVFLDGRLAADTSSPGVAGPFGVSVLGRQLSTGDEVLLTAVLGAVLLVGAIWSFSRQE